MIPLPPLTISREHPLPTAHKHHPPSSPAATSNGFSQGRQNHFEPGGPGCTEPYRQGTRRFQHGKWHGDQPREKRGKKSTTRVGEGERGTGEGKRHSGEGFSRRTIRFSHCSIHQNPFFPSFPKSKASTEILPASLKWVSPKIRSLEPLTKSDVGSSKGLSFYGSGVSTKLEMRSYQAREGGVEDLEGEKEVEEEREGDGE